METEGFPLLDASETLPSMPPNGKPPALYVIPSVGSTLASGLIGVGGRFTPLTTQKRQVVAEIAGQVSGDDLGGKGLLVLGPLAAPEDGFDLRYAPLGSEAFGHFGKVEYRDVPIRRQNDGVSHHLDHEARTRREGLARDFVLDVDRRLLQPAGDLRGVDGRVT